MESEKEIHGRLIEFSYGISRSGMMMGSGFYLSQSLRWENSQRIVLTVTSSGSGKRTLAEYEIPPEAAEKIERFVLDRDLAEVSKIEFPKELIAYDDVTSATISMTFDDREVGGLPYTVRKIYCPSSGTFFGALEKEAQEKINECRAAGKLIRSEETVDQGSLNPFALRPEKPADLPVFSADGTWRCPECGSEGNTGRFCPECGSPRPKE